MSRLSRTRTTRAIATVVVAGIVAGAVVEYRRTHRAEPATAKPALAAAAPQPKPVAPLQTRTAPDGITLLSATPAPAPARPAEPTPSAVGGATVLADAKAKASAGDLIGARKLLNDALIAGGTSDADTAAIKSQLTDVNKVLLFSGRPFAADPLGGVYRVAPGDTLIVIARRYAVPQELLMEINHISDPKKLQAGKNLKVINGPFNAVVSKGRFTLDLYLGEPGGTGSTFVESFPVGLGENNSTPTGMWEIKNKAPSPAYYSPRGEGVIPPGDPKNPLGPFWLGLEGTDGNAVGAESYGIHGTIDPNSIGKMASMGCVRLRNPDITAVYKLLVEKKSKVKVVD